MIKEYYKLTKPGIIRGNLITAAAGLFLASKGDVKVGLFLATLIGIGLIIASACVANNYIDRDIDKKMSRTKKRALAEGTIPGHNALTYSFILGLIGSLVLIIFTPIIVFILALVAFIFYVVFYGISKRRSIYGTLIGSVSGAIPPAAGYCAVSGNIDLAAVLLFIILVCWQMPHFYAIAIYRYDDYKAAGIPVLPVKTTINQTKLQILLYIVAFTIAAELLSIFGYTHILYTIIAGLIGIAWLVLALNGYKKTDSKVWARKLFIFSLVVITVLCLTLCIDSFIK